ncbi:MBL fold metallo-hydrolase [Longispora albida]|uniref:MBL fold metallo-hydrolase n=1 Tax=Longispora albida TaxID=203523 RepID=UPI0003619033|nr:MBL fold metallo-hydrolase [Longispora albida]
MKLTVLGCAGSFPGPQSACSAYLVEADGFRLLVDFGTGALGALQRYGELYGVDAIIITHLHADHMLDACSYVVARRYCPSGALPQIPLYGPQGVADRLHAAYGHAGETLDDVYAFHELRPGTLTIGPFAIATELMDHPVETYGLRISHGGRSLAYSSDTGPCDALLKLAEGADAFLCEASYLEGADNPPHLHLTGKDAGEHATRAGVKRLLLTHLVQAWGNEEQTVSEVEASFDGPFDVVRAGAQYEI